MMSSWLNQKAGEATTQKLDALSTTPIPSSPPQADEARAHRMSTENQPATYTTPHDIVLSELHRTFLKSGPTDTPSDPKENQDAATQAPTKEAAQQSTSRAPSTDVLMDPFDGSMLGVLLPQGQGSDSRNPSQVNLATNPPEGGPTGMYANPAGSEAVWSQLSRVLDIQGEISKMHLDMETIGLNKTKTGSAKKSQWKRRHKTPPPDTLGPSSDLGRGDISGVNWPRHRTLSTVSTISSSGEPEGDEAGVNFQDDDEAKTRIRGEEFARLASQFEGRKEAIYDIMAKASLTFDLQVLQTDFKTCLALRSSWMTYPRPSASSTNFPFQILSFRLRATTPRVWRHCRPNRTRSWEVRRQGIHTSVVGQ
jgi:hypothetical protein